MPPHPSLPAQEREAADIFGRTDRRGPPTNSVVGPIILFLPLCLSLLIHDLTPVEKRCLGPCDSSLPLSTCISQTLSRYQYCQVFQGVS